MKKTPVASIKAVTRQPRTLDKTQLPSVVGGDIYMHNPPGSNDRNRP